jgi:uncharacterized protein (DUF342 family)
MDLALHISPDRLSAVLDLPAGTYLEPAMLKMLLNKLDIRSGLQRDGLVAATVADDLDRELVLAIGDPATPGEPGRLEPPLDPAQLPRAVAQGEVLGRWLPPTPGSAGLGVDGAALPPPADAPGMHPGHALSFSAGGEVVALRTGLLTLGEDGVLFVQQPGLSEHALAELPLRIDAQACEVRLPLASGAFAEPAALLAALARAQVVHGIDQQAISEASCGSPFARDLVVARGTASVPGVDAQLELLVDERVHFRADDFDRVDYHELHRAREVAAGAPLARLHPASPGAPGRSVTGRELPAHAGRPLDLQALCGEGTRISAGDPALLEAAAAGVYRRTRSGKFQVQPQLVIEGDVDLTSGNLDTALSVMITGDVKAGFTVKSGADIVVMGVVEDARVSARGNISVRGGILPGRQRVKAHGNLVARYITGREVKGRDIEVAGSVRFSRVLATGAVTAKEIIAGRLIAAGNLTCESLGSLEGSRTQVQVGIDPYEEALFMAAQQEQGRHAREVVRLKERCKLLAHKLGQQEPMAEGEVDPLSDDLRTALGDFAKACTHLAECEAVITRHEEQIGTGNRAAASAIVTVRRIAHPGVEVLIGELARTEVRDALQAPVFRFQAGTVVWG